MKDPSFILKGLKAYTGCALLLLLLCCQLFAWEFELNPVLSSGFSGWRVHFLLLEVQFLHVMETYGSYISVD